MQRYVGMVVGTAMKGTIKVCVERLFREAPHLKVVRLRRNFLVDDPAEAAVVGDLVAIEYAGRKLSARKAFRLTEVLRAARRFVHPVTGATYTAPDVVRQPACFWDEPSLHPHLQLGDASGHQTPRF